MASVNIELIPWLTDLLDQPQSRRVSWKEEISQEESVRCLLSRLHHSYPRLMAAVYSVEYGRLTGRVNLILNDRALELAGGLDATLREGDRLVLVPAYTGG